MARLPSTISLIRRGGTAIARASAVCDSFIGLRNSSTSISPRCGFCRRSVVVDDLDLVRMAFPPGETNSPLIVDVDRMLSLPFAAPRFRPIARRRAKVFKPRALFSRRSFRSMKDGISDGSLRLRRPSQIVAGSLSRKLTINPALV